MSSRKRNTVAAFESRIPIFGLGSAPLYKGVVESKWGRATITGRLKQAHRDILDVLFTYFEPEKVRGNEVVYLVTTYSLLKGLGLTDTGKNRRDIVGRLRDLRAAELMVEREGATSYSGILRTVQVTTKPSREGMYYLGIEVDPSYIRLIEGDVGIRYTPEQLGIIIDMPPAAQAVARFMLSHSRRSQKFQANFALKRAIECVGIPRGTREARRAREYVLGHREEFQRLGIQIDGVARSEVLRLADQPGTRSEPSGRVQGALSVL